MALAALPDFPWDQLTAPRQLAGEHPDGVIDLSVGTPIDPVSRTIVEALYSSANFPGYPTVHGTSELRKAYVRWLHRAHGVHGMDPEAVLPTIGSKELVASLPTQLGLGAGDLVLIPELAYPTYEVGALLAGAGVVRSDSLTAVGPERVRMVWLNSPSNPTGKVLPTEHLAKVVQWARNRSVILASDECYLDLGWSSQVPSILDPEVCGGDFTGILAVHSLSKRSNVAGYRVGFVSGDPKLVASLTALRRHTGAMVPGPVQHAAAVALDDDSHVVIQRGRYTARRELLTAALTEAGFDLGAEADARGGLYLWASYRSTSAAELVQWFAARGIVVAPGTFYGPAGARHVRIALTATDGAIERAGLRIAG